MNLKADDGTLLEVKEATVLSSQGDILLEPDLEAKHFRSRNQSSFQNVKVFRLNSLWFLPILTLIVILILTLGTAFISVFFLALLGVTLFRGILRLLGLRN